MSTTTSPAVTSAPAPRGVARLLAHSDLVAALAVVTVVSMLVIPLPPMLLDFLITLNVASGLMIVVATMYVS